jgi:hypothetical protein
VEGAAAHDVQAGVPYFDSAIRAAYEAVDRYGHLQDQVSHRFPLRCYDPRTGQIDQFRQHAIIFFFVPSYSSARLWQLEPSFVNGSEPPTRVPDGNRGVPLVGKRNLLYTGVTRGKRLVVLVGQKKAVAIAVRNVSGRRRWSKLAEWLSADVSKRYVSA